MSNMAQSLRIHAGFPGGNIIVEEYLPEAIKLRSASSGTEGGCPWWYFEAENLEAEAFTARFIFPDNTATGAAGPCVNVDNGNWRWLGRECVEKNTFEFRFTPDMHCCRFAYSLPYVQTDLNKFLLTRPSIERLPLTRSEENREIELLHIPAATARKAIFISAGHQSGAGIGSYMLEGVMDEWRNNRGILADQAELFVLPLADADGIEDGSPGRGRPPYDPGRDYGYFRYRVTAAYFERLQRCRERITLLLDFRATNVHAPAFLWDEPATTGKLSGLNTAFAERRQGQLSCAVRDAASVAVLPDGCAAYARTALQLENAFTLAIPDAEAGNIRINEDRARMVGRDLVRAIEAFVTEMEIS